MMKKRRVSSISARERRASTMKALGGLGEHLYNQMINGEFPWVRIPSRSTANIHYDEEHRQYVLGDKSVRRSSRNIRHIKPLTRLVWTARFVHSLCDVKKTSTLRDVFYSAQAYDVYFKDQAESDRIITDLESILGYAREDLNVFPEERSAVFGDLTIEYTVPGYEGKRLNLTTHPDGIMIGPALTSADLVKTSTQRVIVIEKGAMFTRLVEEGAFKKFNAILVHTAGQPPRATRRFVKRLNEELDLPVFIFCDADPWGMAIAVTIICGSANAAHIRGLTTPEAIWMGAYSTDIEKYSLPSNKLSEVDIKRLRDMMKDPRYQGEPWANQINDFLRHRRKCELEAFSRYGLDYVVKKYLPDKFREFGV